MNNKRSFSQISTNQRSDIQSTLHEFNKLFEDQLNSINSQDSDSIKNKIQIYEEWVKRLLEEISTLVECIQEMENQTAHSLDALKENLNMSCLTDERTKALQNDLNAIVEIIRRARVFGKWNTDGIKLEYLTFNDIFGDHQSQIDKNTYLEFEQPNPLTPNLYTLNIELNAKQLEGKPNSETEIHRNRVDDSQSFPTDRDMYDIDSEHANIINDAKVNHAEQEILFKKMKNRNAELVELIEELKQENRRLMKTNVDTRVLVEEVASRHDEIQKYKSEIMSLEEQLKTQDKSMCYRDEIIKELRKDCKKLSSSTPPMPNKNVESSKNSEFPRNMNHSDSKYRNDDMVLEKSYNTKTNITNRLLEIFNFVQSSLQPSDYVYASDSGILSDYMPPTLSSNSISDEDLNTALTSFASRMNTLEKENGKLQMENEKLKEELTKKIDDVKNLITKHSTDYPTAERDDVQQDVSQMDNHLSDDGSLFTSSHIDRLTNQIVILQKEIDSKDQIIQEKDTMIASLIECGILKDRELNDLRNRISSMECYSYSTYDDNRVETHSTTDDSMTVKNGDIGQLAHLLVDLQQEIETKDKLLKDKDELIVSLRDSETAKNCELHELRKKLESNSNRNEETVNNLRDALDIHIKTINQQQIGNNHLENKIKDLELYISNIDRNYILLQEKCRKLEVENNDQLTTISNLRSAVEEHSKRSGRYHVSNKDHLNIETFILSEQICDLFNENIRYEKKIDLLQDDNLYLRGEMYLWSQDYSYLEDKFLVYLSETRDAYENITTNETKVCNTNVKCNEGNAKPIFTENISCPAVLRYIKNMEENITEELKNYKNTVEDFKIFKDSIEELSSQLNILSNESKFSQKLIEDSTLLLESFQHLQQENEDLKGKHEISQKQSLIVESQANELRSENTTLKEELKVYKVKLDEQIEVVKRVENDKNAMIDTLNSKNVDLTNKLSEHRHQRDIDELLISHQEYQKAKEMSTQLTNEVAQRNILVSDLNQEILRQSLALEKQKDDRYEMSKQLESAFEITEKLRFTIDSNLKSISHLQEENEKLKQELNQNISTIEKVQADQNTKELEMINKNDLLQQIIEEHVKARRVSDKSLIDMSVQNQKLNQHNEDLLSEITHLKEEIDRLKGQINSLESNNSLMTDMHDDVEHVRSQLEKLLVNITDKENELTKLRKCNSMLSQQNVTHVNNQRTLESKFSKVIEKCKEMKEEYDLLKNNYEKLYEIKEKLTNSLNVSTNAIDELKEREELSNQLLSKQDEHIRTLLHDRSTLKMKMDQMHRDMLILNSRLDSIDLDTQRHHYEPSSETVTRKTKMVKYRSVPSLNTPDETLQAIQKIRRKIYETRSFWQNGMEEVFK